MIYELRMPKKDEMKMYPKVNILYPKRIQMYPKMDTFYILKQYYRLWCLVHRVIKNLQ